MRKQSTSGNAFTCNRMPDIPPADTLIPEDLQSKSNTDLLQPWSVKTRHILVLHQHSMVVLETLAGAAPELHGLRLSGPGTSWILEARLSILMISLRVVDLKHRLYKSKVAARNRRRAASAWCFDSPIQLSVSLCLFRCPCFSYFSGVEGRPFLLPLSFSTSMALLRSRARP